MKDLKPRQLPLRGPLDESLTLEVCEDRKRKKWWHVFVKSTAETELYRLPGTSEAILSDLVYAPDGPDAAVLLALLSWYTRLADYTKPKADGGRLLRFVSARLVAAIRHYTAYLRDFCYKCANCPEGKAPELDFEYRSPENICASLMFCSGVLKPVNLLSAEHTKVCSAYLEANVRESPVRLHYPVKYEDGRQDRVAKSRFELRELLRQEAPLREHELPLYVVAEHDTSTCLTSSWGRPAAIRISVRGIRDNKTLLEHAEERLNLWFPETLERRLKVTSLSQGPGCIIATVRGDTPDGYHYGAASPVASGQLTFCLDGRSHLDLKTLKE